MAVAEMTDRITDEGKRAFEACVEAMRDREGQTWAEFPSWVEQKTGVQPGKDALYRTAQGNYRHSANLKALIAYKRLGEQGYLLDLSGNPLSFDAIEKMLTGQIDRYGKAVKSQRKPKRR